MRNRDELLGLFQENVFWKKANGQQFAWDLVNMGALIKHFLIEIRNESEKWSNTEISSIY